jgi:hypothetical protein
LNTTYPNLKLSIQFDTWKMFSSILYVWGLQEK